MLAAFRHAFSDMPIAPIICRRCAADVAADIFDCCRRAIIAFRHVPAYLRRFAKTYCRAFSPMSLARFFAVSPLRHTMPLMYRACVTRHYVYHTNE